MNIEITEEEREFFDRVCKRALTFSKMGIKSTIVENHEINLEKLQILIEKLKK